MTIVALVPYDRDFLNRSWEWLQDPETRELTLTPEFDRQAQERFFSSLPLRSDYRIWGVTLDQNPIGAAGLKHIAEHNCEYWGYIGDKAKWGQGLGRAMLSLVLAEAREMGLKHVNLEVSRANVRARRLYQSVGFKEDAANAAIILMSKDL